jgi:hypothetical protein
MVSDDDPTAEQVTVSRAGPTITTDASPTSITLTPDTLTAPPTLTDTADLEGGFNPTGSIVFTLTGPGGFSFTQTDTVNGNGPYTASTTLPTAGTVAGTYTWTVHYTGDANNNAANDQGGPAEQTVVNPASPAITTTAGPDVVVSSGVPLTDSATLTGGFNPGGTITFTLEGPGGGVVYTNVVTVSGNGTYDNSVGTNPGGFLPTVPGTYEWLATYSGDDNNHPIASFLGDEPVRVIRPEDVNIDFFTLAGPTVTVGSGEPLTDTAVLTAEFAPPGRHDHLRAVRAEHHHEPRVH